jgi:hypothetical protein
MEADIIPDLRFKAGVEEGDECLFIPERLEFVVNQDILASDRW